MKPECKQCGECCRYFAIKRVMKTKHVVEYMEARGYKFDGTTMLIPSVCPQLTEEGKCKIYETRPQVCRDYEGKSGKFYVPVGCVFRK
jgi:Fe-S-cluster containining protein